MAKKKNGSRGGAGRTASKKEAVNTNPTAQSTPSIPLSLIFKRSNSAPCCTLRHCVVAATLRDPHVPERLTSPSYQHWFAGFTTRIAGESDVHRDAAVVHDGGMHLGVKGCDNPRLPRPTYHQLFTNYTSATAMAAAAAAEGQGTDVTSRTSRRVRCFKELYATDLVVIDRNLAARATWSGVTTETESRTDGSPSVVADVGTWVDSNENLVALEDDKDFYAEFNKQREKKQGSTTGMPLQQVGAGGANGRSGSSPQATIQGDHGTGQVIALGDALLDEDDDGEEGGIPSTSYYSNSRPGGSPLATTPHTAHLPRSGSYYSCGTPSVALETRYDDNVSPSDGGEAAATPLDDTPDGKPAGGSAELGGDRPTATSVYNNARWKLLSEARRHVRRDVDAEGGRHHEGRHGLHPAAPGQTPELLMRHLKRLDDLHEHHELERQAHRKKVQALEARLDDFLRQNTELTSQCHQLKGQARLQLESHARAVEHYTEREQELKDQVEMLNEQVETSEQTKTYFLNLYNDVRKGSNQAEEYRRRCEVLERQLAKRDEEQKAAEERADKKEKRHMEYVIEKTKMWGAKINDLKREKKELEVQVDELKEAAKTERRATELREAELHGKYDACAMQLERVIRDRLNREVVDAEPVRRRVVEQSQQQELVALHSLLTVQLSNLSMMDDYAM